MGRKYQTLKCSGHRTDGQPCGAWAITGGTVCVAHGGGAPQVKAKAAANVAERKAQALLEGITDFEPITDPTAELARLAGRVVRWLDVLEGIVSDLHRIRYTAETEQIDGRVIVFERAMDRAGKLLVDIAKLNLDERMVRVSEAQGKLVIAAMLAAFRELGITAEVQQELRPVVARHLRLTATVEQERGQVALPAPVPARAG